MYSSGFPGSGAVSSAARRLCSVERERVDRPPTGGGCSRATGGMLDGKLSPDETDLSGTRGRPGVGEGRNDQESTMVQSLLDYRPKIRQVADQGWSQAQIHTLTGEVDERSDGWSD